MTGKSLASASFSSSKAALSSCCPLVSIVKNAEIRFSSFSSSYGYNDGEPYTIHFFLGPVDGEPSLYEKHPNHIDIIYTFSSQVETVPGPSEGESKPKCENCAKQKADGVLSKGQIILTSALLKDATDATNSELNSLEPDDVNRYLKRHLNWRAVDVSFHPPSSFQKSLYLPSLLTPRGMVALGEIYVLTRSSPPGSFFFTEWCQRDQHWARIATDKNLCFERFSRSLRG